MSTAVWTGGAGDHQWNTPGNWQANAVPTSGESVDFPAIGQGSNSQAINLDSNVTIGDLTIEATNQYITGGYSLTLNGNIAVTGTGDGVYFSMVLTHNTTIDVGTSADFLLFDTSDGGNHFGITETGDGSLGFPGHDTYTGTTEVAQGDSFQVGAVISSFTLDAGATIGGDYGSFGGLTDNGGTVALTSDGGPTNLYSTGNVSMGAGSTLAEGYASYGGGELIASGSSVDISNSTLTFSLFGGATASVGTVIPVISNLTGNPIVGTFHSLPEGAIANFGGNYFKISYVGGSLGRDVTMTAVAVPAAPSVVSVMSTSTVSTRQAALSILGLDPATNDDSTLTYTWSVTHAPAGAKPVTFSENGTNAAKNATAIFRKAGTYHLHCIVLSTDGLTVTRNVSIVVTQIPSLRLSPHRQIIVRGGSIQYSGKIEDQFGHAILATAPTKYAVESGHGTITSDGLFTAATMPGHVVIQIMMDDLLGTVGATVV